MVTSAILTKLGMTDTTAQDKLFKALAKLDLQITKNPGDFFEWRTANLRLFDTWIMPLSIGAPRSLALWARYVQAGDDSGSEETAQEKVDDVVDSSSVVKFWSVVTLVPSYHLWEIVADFNVEADGFMTNYCDTMLSSLNSSEFADCSNGYQGLEASALSKARCCPVDLDTGISICQSNSNNTNYKNWSSDSQCQATYRGTLCLECIENYVRVGDNCKECQGGASLGMAFMAGACMIVPVFIGVMVSLLCEGKTNKAASDGTKIVGQMKILLTFIQILSSMKTTYNGIPWRKSSYRTYFFLHCYRDPNTVDINSY